MRFSAFFPDVKLVAADFDSVLEEYGKATLVRRSVTCPCIDPETRRADPTCDACGGWGWLYPAAREVENLKVQWTAHDQRKVEREGGQAEPGQYTVTWPSTQVLGPGDIFVHPTEEAVADEVLIRGATAPDGLTLDRLRHRLVTGVEDVRTEAGAYADPADFSMNADTRTFEWVAGRGPAAGVLYTVRYRYRSEYVIAGDMPKVRTDGDARLAHRARVQRYDPSALAQGDNLGEAHP